MKEMTLKELQAMNLEILSDVHEFCVSNDIKYSLAYGTMLGAVRHQGFIPWDDDADVILPRPDYDKFCTSYKSDKGFRILPPDSPDSYIPFARVYDTQRTKMISRTPWCGVDAGAFIDVFPLDGLDINVPDINKQELKEHLFWVDNVKRRKLLVSLSEIDGLKKKIKHIIKRCIWRGGKKKIRKIINHKLEEYSQHQFEGSECFDQIVNRITTHWDFIYKKDFEKFLLMKFEDKEFFVMNGYDGILRRRYGDYLVIPPEEKREPPMSYYKMYWK
jgi:lipopolysaccharide cholinephosphotransferase